MKKLLSLMALAGATTIAITACGTATKEFDFTAERVNEYKSEFKDADFTTTAHTLTEGFKLEEEVVGLREGYANTEVGSYFWTVFQVTTTGFNGSIIDWNGHKSTEILTWAPNLISTALPYTTWDEDFSKQVQIESPVATKYAGDVYLAKVWLNVFSPSKIKQLSLFNKIDDKACYSIYNEKRYDMTCPITDVDSKKMYKLN